MWKTQAVIDLGFGDSGKGTFTSYLCSKAKYPIVERFCGGHQAGHTVVTDEDIRHIFSSFGSGTLQGVPTYWSDKCTFHPTSFLNELEVLNSKGVNKPKIYVDENCPITTPCDIVYNRKEESNKKHGSCGVGFGATLEREDKYYSLLVGDLRYPAVFKQKLNIIQSYYSYYGYNDLSSFIEECNEVLNHIDIVDKIPMHYRYHTLIYEGSQGLLLDKNIGFFPNVTRANVGLKGINDSCDEVFYITRAYQTRHGNGPMTNEDITHNIKSNPNETNIKHIYQGEFRRTLLDLDLLKYSYYRDLSKYKVKEKNLVITCLDHIENELRFTLNGKIIQCSDETDFINRVSREFPDIKSVYISRSEKFNEIIKYY